LNKNLIIIDGHNYLYRAYYGIPASAVLPNGTKVNAYYGFMSFLRKVVEEYNPKQLLVVFDSERGIEQKQKSNPNYKNNRNYEDKQIFEQLEIIKKALKYCEIDFLEDQKFEADDVIASLSSIYSRSGNFVYISSNDSDFIQCIEENVVLLKSVRGKYVEYTMDYVEKEFGFIPPLYLDYLSLKGDPSDNIDGVPGIGKKTGIKLIQKYKGIEKIFDASNTNSKILRLVKENKDRVRSNKEFLKINDNLKIETEIKYINTDLLLGKTSNEILKELNLY
jgi:DNA polymerase I